MTMFRQYLLTKLLFTKTLVALESTRAYIEKNLEMLVVSRETERYSKVFQASKLLIVGYEGIFFHLGAIGTRVSSVFDGHYY